LVVAGAELPPLAAVERGEPGGDPLVGVLAEEDPAADAVQRRPDALERLDGDPLGGVGALDVLQVGVDLFVGASGVG
jgi:hypothetical protein